MSEENIAFVRGLYDAFGKGDVPGLLGMFDENIEWYEAEGMPYGGLYRGPQAIAENVFARIVEDVEGFAVVPKEFYAGGDEVLVVANYSGKGAESGKPLDLDAAHAWEIKNGKVTRFRQFADTEVFNAALEVGAAA